MIIEYCLVIWPAPAEEVDDKLADLLTAYAGAKPLAFFNLEPEETGILFESFEQADTFVVYVNDTRMYFADQQKTSTVINARLRKRGQRPQRGLSPMAGLRHIANRTTLRR